MSGTELLLAVTPIVALLLLIRRAEYPRAIDGRQIWLSPLDLYTPPGCFPMFIPELADQEAGRKTLAPIGDKQRQTLSRSRQAATTSGTAR
jgi:hypothetical protein